VLIPPAARKQLPPRPLKGRLKPKKRTDAGRQAFLSATGGWSDIDADALIEQICADRRNSNRLPPEP
jgi:hypothetical protein